jgi:hypothetical protein
MNVQAKPGGALGDSLRERGHPAEVNAMGDQAVTELATRTGTPGWVRCGRGSAGNLVPAAPDGPLTFGCGELGPVLVPVPDRHQAGLRAKHTYEQPQLALGEW